MSDLVVQVEIQLSRLRRDVARWVLWAALVSVVVVAGLCLAVVAVLV